MTEIVGIVAFAVKIDKKQNDENRQEKRAFVEFLFYLEYINFGTYWVHIGSINMVGLRNTTIEVLEGNV